MHHLKPILAFLILVLIAVSLWANRALPGSSFYGYKVSVNAPVVKLLHIGLERKGRYEVDLMHKRLLEAVTVLSRDNFTDEIRDQWLGVFVLQAQNSVNHITSIESQQKLLLAHKLAAEHAAVLAAHREILAVFPDSTQNAKNVLLQVDPLLNRAGAKELGLREELVESYEPQQFIANIDELLRDLEEYKAKVEKFYASKRAVFSEDQEARLAALLDVAVNQIREAKDKHAADFYAQGASAANQARGTLRQVETLVAAYGL